MTRSRIGFLAVVALSAVLVWALPAGAHTKVGPTTVTVTAGKPTEFHFSLSTSKVKSGLIIFKVTNKGALSHDFSIGGRKTPLISPGKSNTLRVTLRKAGKYPYLCTVTGHAAAGMKGVLTVT
jgi:uncharacterized cupredoxin-like copper-binding protein